MGAALVGGITTGILVWLRLASGAGVVLLNQPVSRSKSTWWRLRRIGGPVTARDSAQIFTEVAALLRAGIPPGVAWHRACGVEVDNLGLPDLPGLAKVVGIQAAISMRAACQLAVHLGAPLAYVLQSVDQAVQVTAKTTAERKAALAGPATTARVLLALPVVGLFLGWLLGAQPINTLLAGGAGTWSFLTGLVLLVTGRLWIAKLVAAAQRTGE